MPASARVTGSLFIVVGFAGCVVTQTEPAEPQPAPVALPEPAPNTAATVDPVPAAGATDADGGATAAAADSDSGSATPVAAGDRAEGSKCSQGSECQSGVCEGKGCGPDEGRCVAKNPPCTYDLVTYCGCDGKPFQASGSCPKRTYKHRGAC